MTWTGTAAILNARWELLRLRRSRRIWLLLLPPVAGSIGSAAAAVVLGVPSVGTARILGLFVTGGLAALLAIDLAALSVGEELSLRAHLVPFGLPQSREGMLLGRLGVVLGAVLGSYAVGAGLVWEIVGWLVSDRTTGSLLLSPFSLLLGLVGLLVYLVGVTAAAAVVARSAAQGLVAGVLGGVVAGGVGSLFLLQHTLTIAYPWGLAAIGLAGMAFALVRYPSLEP